MLHLKEIKGYDLISPEVRPQGQDSRNSGVKCFLEHSLMMLGCLVLAEYPISTFYLYSTDSQKRGNLAVKVIKSPNTAIFDFI